MTTISGTVTSRSEPAPWTGSLTPISAQMMPPMAIAPMPSINDSAGSHSDIKICPFTEMHLRRKYLSLS